MSAIVCAMGHPMLESQAVCPLCGLAPMPATASAPAPMTETLAPAPAEYEFAASTAPRPAAAAAGAPVSPPSVDRWGLPTAPTQGWSQSEGGAASVHPIGTFDGGSSGRSRMWIVVAAIGTVAVVLVGGLIWWSQRPKSAPAAAPLPAGTTVTTARGVGITTPPGWTVVRPTPHAIAVAQSKVKASNPVLANALKDAKNPHQRFNLRFVAYGPTKPDGFTTDASIEVFQSTAPMLSVLAAARDLLVRAGAVNIAERPLPRSADVGQSDGAELSYQYRFRRPDGSKVNVKMLQVYESNGLQGGVLTLATAGPADPTIQSLIDSFRIG